MDDSNWPAEFAARIAAGEDRWVLIDEFIRWWYGSEFRLEGNSDAEIDAAETRIGVKLPTALRRWYRYAGKSLQIVNGQDTFFNLDDLKPMDYWNEHLVIRMECQCVHQWGFTRDSLSLADPPVHIFDRAVDLGHEEKSLSDFLLFNVLYESLHSTAFGAWGNTNNETAEGLRAHCVNTGWSPRYWLEESEIYLAQSAVSLYMPQCDQIYACFRSEVAKRDMTMLIAAEWCDR